MQITLEYLRKHLDHIFVYGDNKLHKGCLGAAMFRKEPNSYGFVTKKYPRMDNKAFYRPYEYKSVFEKEINYLIHYIELYPEKTFLITPLGSGLANKYKIWEQVIKPGLEVLRKYKNVIFTWEVTNENR